MLPSELLKAAAARCLQLGVGADRVLLHWGVIDEAAYLRRLAWHTGIGTESFARISREQCPLSDDQILFAPRHDLLPLRIDGELVWVVAPRGRAARRLTELASRHGELTGRLRLTSSSQLRDFLEHGTGGVLARNAANGLAARFPMLCAAPTAKHRAPLRTLIARVAKSAAIALLLTTFLLAPEVWGNVAALGFLGVIGLRLAASTIPAATEAAHRAPDETLPVYSVVAALYREASSVAALMRALEALDYPREKLDLIVVVEPDDLQTRAALSRLGPRPHLRVLVAPALGPRTKPKALNFALPFARGSFIAVYDAEDRPDPGQLRVALAAFRNGGEDLACAQASLCIDNAGDSFFSRMFAAEYAGQFDLVLPGLARLGLPFALGGSSNHFRTQALRAVGGWDAFNVTEDADLGFRFARFGYRTTTIASTTYEEAPIRFGPWLRQRSRWLKGWMQTWGVHMREPRRLWRNAGWRGVLALNLIVGGSISTALAFPILIGGCAAYLAAAAVAGDPHRLLEGMLTPLHIACVGIGLGGTILIGWRGLARRGRWREGWIMTLTPLYWGCLSIAAWRALWQLLRDPYRWEKTEHGLAKSRHAVTPSAPIAEQRAAGAG